MAMIQSHKDPDKSLRQHVDEVEKAATAILDSHSLKVQKILSACLNLTIKFHDLGKAISEFQKYIRNPQNYSKPTKYKAHTPVSLLLWLLYAKENKISDDLILLVATSVWKHHGDFPTFEDIVYRTLYEYEEDYKISEYPLDQICHELEININQTLNAYEFDADDFDIEDLISDIFFEDWQIEAAAEYKVKALLLFSILAEADRTFLALSENYLKQRLSPFKQIKIIPGIIDKFLNKKIKQGCQNTALNQQRTNLRNTIIKNSSKIANIESVTLPTGLGKTMVAAEWALTHRNMAGAKRKVIIILPYLSIIDQTVKEYKNLLEEFDTDSLILEAHSIANRKYNVDDSNEDQNSKINNSIDFLADTWSSDFIITTFDQFLYTLLSSKNKHLIRLNNFADALVIIDEVQALPSTLWEPLSLVLNTISKTINTKTLVMSATQPKYLQTKELVPCPEKIFNKQNRYKLVLKHRKPISLKAFIEDCIKRIEVEEWHLKRVLIILNTRLSARNVLDELETKIECPTLFLSADVTPKERLLNIEEIKENNPCLVIATQCIEAGVDIDMDMAIRDLAPLDSIVQCAGRCNRNGLKARAKVEIISLIDSKGNKFSNFIYDVTLLEKTLMVLSSSDDILEENIYQLVQAYYEKFKDIDTGKKIAQQWAFWEKTLDVKKLLRNDNLQYSFIVIEQDEPKNNEMPLKEAITSALDIQSVWDRKRKLRSLQKRIAELTVSVWANNSIVPEEIAESRGPYFLLKDGFYITGKGINIENSNVTTFVF